MDVTFVIMIFLLQGLWETEAFVKTADAGTDVQIKCSHSNAHSNVKYFCKNTCKDKDILITSKTKSEKYNIKDEGNIFHVTISDLKEADSGKHWCGVERIGLDTYNEVVIQVIKRENDNKDKQETSTKALSSKKLVYIGAGLGVVVLALALVLLIFMRHRKKGISKSKGKDQETIYAIPLTQKQDGQRDSTASSANEDKEINIRVKNMTDRNSNVSSGPQIQADGLLYSTVSFVKNKDCSPSSPRPPKATFPSLKHVQAEESTVYSSVKTQC